jgi:disulfide oxidoreductase YuzD
MHHKHGSGDTLTFYGTEGAGVSFIGNKSTIETSESGQVALNLFRKFVEGKYKVQYYCDKNKLQSRSKQKI